MRSVTYRFDDLEAFRATLLAAEGQELVVPAGQPVHDGEWVLALFEFGGTRRATAAAGKGVLWDDDGGHALVFERRDWERLLSFAAPHRLLTPLPPEAPPAPPAPTPSEALRRTWAWESQPEPVAEDPTIVQARRPSSAGARVLIVDDDDDLRDVIAAMLETVGLVPTASASAEDAWPVLLAECPDLLVLDWNLPGETGIALCRRIRQQTALAHLPVLFLTAHSATSDVVEAFAAGADDYVVKPFRAAELGARIFGLLRRTRAGR